MRKLIAVVLVALALVVAGCGSSSSSSSVAPGTSSTGTVHLAKTKFLLHAGLAFGAFHRWIYKPFKAGELQHPFTHKLTFIKALAAGGFVLHEVRLARADAAHSKLLSHVVLPLAEVGTSVALIHAALARHHVDAPAINSANSSIAKAHAESSAAGQPITETTAGAPI
jgi:hypothetical protein